MLTSGMTEDKAKTKWCPFSRPSVIYGGVRVISARHDQNPDPNTMNRNCIGSACMAWRWEEERKSANETRRILSQTEGYCGLAGKP